jgi:hypothetical protein
MQQFLRSIPEAAGLLNSQVFEYRYRSLTFDPAGTSHVPTTTFEGITRLEYRDSGVFTDEVYLEDKPLSSRFCVAFHKRMFHSFLTGEYARASRLSGGLENVIVERWRGLPKLTYLALGLLGPTDAMQSAQLRSTRLLENGLSETEYLVKGGKTLTLLCDPAPPGRLLRAESRAPNDSWTAIRYFEDHIAGLGGLPDRPRRIVEAKVDQTGFVVEVSVWQAVERLDPPSPIADVVDRGAAVARLVHGNMDKEDSVTDRPMRLEELLNAYRHSGSVQALPQARTASLNPATPPALNASEARSPSTHAPFAATQPGGNGLANLGLPLLGMLTAVAMIFTALINRKRNSTS